MLLTGPNLAQNNIEYIQPFQQQQDQHQHEQQQLPQNQLQLQLHRQHPLQLRHSRPGGFSLADAIVDESQAGRRLDLNSLLPAIPNIYHPGSQPSVARADTDLDIGLVNLDVDLDLDDLDSLISTDSTDASSSNSVQSLRPLQNLGLDGFVGLGGGGSFDGFDNTASTNDIPTAGPTLKNPPAPFPCLTTTAAARTDLMHGDAWLSHGQISTTKPVPSVRASHNRESSLSSLGSTSAGPASPYSQTTSNPHIAVTDSPGDGYHGLALPGLPGSDDTYYHLAKSLASNAPDASTFYPNYPAYHASPAVSAAYPLLASTASNKLKSGRNMLPPPELSGPSARSRPVSVASSIASDSPATPSAMEQHQHQQHQQHQAEEERRRRHAGLGALPKLDRTMTDVFSDELYNPNFAINATASPVHHANAAGPNVPISPSHEMFAQRLQAANSQHLSAVHSPVISVSRGRSPFRNGSPLAPSPAHDFGSSLTVAQARHNPQFGPVQQMRDGRTAEQDARVHHAMRQPMVRASDTTTPQTISPQEAMLEYKEPEGGANFPLFPPSGPADAGAGTSFTDEQISKAVADVDFDGMALDTTSFGYTQGIPVPQQYPFVSQAAAAAPLRHVSSPVAAGPIRLPLANATHLGGGAIGGNPGVGATGGGSAGSSSGSSSGSSNRSRSPVTSSPRRQDDAPKGMDGGTYTCTYHGCTLRFDTPVLLQKHKREGHRQAHGLGGSGSAAAPGQKVDLGSGIVQLNTQAGPHRCDRINPSTGKPCGTIFSRPYDLTRHEDTIHNARKQKVRCDHCTEEKTFSRADALTRHYRVCHPDIPIPGKFRRRAMRGALHSQGPY